MPQSKRNCDSLVLNRSDLWVVWRFYGVLRVRCYYFCLEPKVRKETWMRMTFPTALVVFSASDILKFTWSHSAQFQFNNKEAHWQQYLERYLQFCIFRTWINIRAKSFIKTSVNIIKTKSMKISLTSFLCF